MTDQTEQKLTEQKLEKIALAVVTLEPGDIPVMGEILKILNDLEKDATRIEDAAFLDLSRGLKGYLEKVILDEEKDIGPFEDGVSALQEMFRSLSRKEACHTDTAALLVRLGCAQQSGQEVCSEQTQTDPGRTDNAEKEPEENPMSDEDIQILGDFIVESLENLDSIELNLIDLEQDPENKETINAIFRPFHTIKGVSGFLNLKDINRLSHSTENLLDSARQGEFKINDAIVDIVLESIDTLKQLIQKVEKSLSSKTSVREGEIDVLPLIRKIGQTTEAAKSGNIKLGEILIEKGAIGKEDLETSLKTQADSPGKKIGKILVDEKKAESKEVISALREQKKRSQGLELHVKVDTHKLDNLVDLTGELVIAQSMLKQNRLIRSAADQKLHQNLNQLTQIVSSLQKVTMSMRMVPIKSTFQKMVRLVRDLARNSGKQVALEMFGEDTEIDRNVVDELYEPLVHMIRNAADHGIETPEERQAAGKSKNGTIRLHAYHKGGNIVIEIEDDGRGLDKTRILEKAIANNLVPEQAELSDSEIFNLIFHPGLSTAKEITDVSGRGVGMDVVKKGIEKLRGRLDIRSLPGQGSTVVVSLPLTLAIIDGMLIRVGAERYIIPTMAILESFQPKPQDFFTVQGKGEMIMVRGSLVPLIRLDNMFDIEGNSKDPWDGLVVVVENKEEKRGLLLDELLGKEEIVIKSLGESLKGIKGLAGGAILGDGKVGLILDMAGLFEVALGHDGPSAKRH